MFLPRAVILSLLAFLGSGSSTSIKKRVSLPPHWKVKMIGNNTSNFPNIYRDGGGGGKVGGKYLVNFSDGLITTGGYPLDSDSNVRVLISNSIVYSGVGGAGPQAFKDFGSNGIPNQEVTPVQPQEDNFAIWPQSNIAPLCGGACGVAFYPVINRSTCPNCEYVYGTGVNITIGANGPVVNRPVINLFSHNLYMFGSITNTTSSNGLKMARVTSADPFDRSLYEYWNGTGWSSTVTRYDDGGKANMFNYSVPTLSGTQEGPNGGDLFYSQFYGVYMLIFQSVQLDPNVYMSYSSSLSGGWSTPVSLFATPTLPNGYNYAIHAYPDYDPMQQVIPVSFA